jgi:hypothetical protein
MERKAAVFAAALVIGASTFVGCSPSRSRPGPPRVKIEIANSASITSPDTFTVVFSAVDDDGLDSLSLRWGNVQFDVNTFFRTEASETVELPVPAGLPPGTTRNIVVNARDLFGQTTVESQTVTIVASP